MTRAVRAGGALWGAGLLWMVVASWGADRYWGFLMAEPPCVLEGGCTYDDLATFQHEAWAALRPGGALTSVGVVVVLVAVLQASGTEPRPVGAPGAAAVGLRTAATTLAVGAVALLPLFLAFVLAPPLGVAALALSATALTGALTAVLRRGLPWWRAAATALLAVLGAGPLALGIGAGLGTTGRYGTALVAGGATLVLAVAVVAATCSARLPAAPVAVGGGS